MELSPPLPGSQSPRSTQRRTLEIAWAERPGGDTAVDSRERREAAKALVAVRERRGRPAAPDPAPSVPDALGPPKPNVLPAPQLSRWKSTDIAPGSAESMERRGALSRHDHIIRSAYKRWCGVRLCDERMS